MGLIWLVTLHAQLLQKDAIEHNRSHCAVITCTQLQPDFHLAPEAPTKYKELCVPQWEECACLSAL